ncbi:hypothetical protein Sjap_021318 [Stephania japonica]|uniref:Glycosyl transferase family 1 domain-containing protein n=1 Tax=Stephania japonica TaxID=461633 RepID=A0AAP0HTC9_9MAGN
MERGSKVSLFVAILICCLGFTVKKAKIVENVSSGKVTVKVTPRPSMFAGSDKSSYAADEYSGLTREELTSIHRKPRIAIILGKMIREPNSMMVFSIVKNLKERQYAIAIFAMEDGPARSYWEELGSKVSILSLSVLTDWTIFEGIIASSLEAKTLIPSLMQGPFYSVPLIWIIGENTLAKRLPLYANGCDSVIDEWRYTFSRASMVVFSDLSQLRLYSMFDIEKSLVIPGSPIDTWNAENYLKSRFVSRRRKGPCPLVVVVGISFFSELIRVSDIELVRYFSYKEMPMEDAIAIDLITPLLKKFAKTHGSSKFIFLFGNSDDRYNEALQEVASCLGLPHGSLMHRGLDDDVNRILLEADIVLQGSFQNEQGFPPLLLRAMSFEKPIIVPDLPIIKKYISHAVQGLLYEKHNSEKLMEAFSILVSERGLTDNATKIAARGKVHAKNMLASECITSYAQLLQSLLQFPIDVSLPYIGKESMEMVWEWGFLVDPEQIDTQLADIQDKENGYQHDLDAESEMSDSDEERDEDEEDEEDEEEDEL